jgi:hydroxyacyl-ACP dehydratase HTD2-like protein with hotdog domain
MLVHGPLTVVMMLSVLRAQLAPGEMVMKFDYRNLAPLFVGEEMKICLKKDKFGHNRWDVWIVGKEGGYAAKGSAQIAMIDSVRE